MLMSAHARENKIDGIGVASHQVSRIAIRVLVLCHLMILYHLLTSINIHHTQTQAQTLSTAHPFAIYLPPNPHLHM